MAIIKRFDDLEIHMVVVFHIYFKKNKFWYVKKKNNIYIYKYLESCNRETPNESEEILIFYKISETFTHNFQIKGLALKNTSGQNLSNFTLIWIEKSLSTQQFSRTFNFLYNNLHNNKSINQSGISHSF